MRTSRIATIGAGVIFVLLAAAPAAAQAPVWLYLSHVTRSDEATRLNSKATTECDTVRPGAWELYQRLLAMLKSRGLSEEDAKSDGEAVALTDEIRRRKAEYEQCLANNSSAIQAEAIRLAAQREYAIPLYFSPNSSAPPQGEIRIRSTDTSHNWALVGGFSSFTYIWGSDPTEIPFPFDQLPHEDFAPYAHTVTAVEGDWLQLPQSPFPFPMWINWRSIFGSAPILSSLPINERVFTIRGVRAQEIGTGTIRVFEHDNVVFIRQEADAFVFRFEQTQDMRCGDSTDLPVREPNARFRVLVDDLLDSNRHFRAQFADLTGCSAAQNK